MSRRKIVLGAISSAILILNTGCLVKYDYKKNKPTKESPNVVYEDVKPKPQNQIANSQLEIQKRPTKIMYQSRELHTLKSIRGKIIRIAEQKTGFIFPNYPGKVMVLEIFGKDCPHCIKEIPVIKRIRKRYRGKLEVVAIQAQQRMSRRTARNYINKYRIQYPIIEGEDATNLQNFIQTTYGWTGILPYTLVIKNGVTEFAYAGAVSYEEMKVDMDSLF